MGREEFEVIMVSFHELEDIISELTHAEKAQVLQWVARDLGNGFPGIETTPNVAGGAACIIRTRIPVWTLVQAQRLGMSEGELLLSYPTLRAEDLVNAWAYAHSHREEIERDIVENETA
jgi:uncharacterized protein (DUF433 family)